MKVVESLPLEDVMPGVILAAPVLDAGGHVLVPAGAELTESLLASLARRDVATLTITRELQEDPAARAARIALVTASLDRLFRRAGDGEASRALYRAVLAFRAEQGA